MLGTSKVRKVNKNENLEAVTSSGQIRHLREFLFFPFIESDVLHHVSQNELIWIHGNCQTGKTDMFSSVLSTSCQVVFAPLVSDLVDQIEESNSSLEKVTF